MSAADDTILLLADAVDRVRANPTASANWHQLYARLYECQDAATRTHALDQLVSVAGQEGMAAFLCATLLAHCTKDPVHLARAGGLAGSVVPYDTDRVLAFCHGQWALTTHNALSHAAFTESLRTAAIPELMRQAGNWLASGSTLPARRPIERPERIAIVAPYIGPDSHPPTEMALKQAALLQREGCTVHVFTAQEMLIPNMEEYSGAKLRVSLTPLDIGTLGGRVPPGVKITLADARLTSARRWRNILRHLGSFDPDVVLFVGLYSPLVDALFGVRPVVGLSVHAMQPMASVDVWLTADEKRRERLGDEWGPALSRAWGHYHPYRASAKLAPPAKRSGEEIVLVTVGARLATEISGQWAERMIDLLQRYPRLRWLLAGGAGTLPAALAAAPAERMRCLPHQSEIAQVYAQSDIYVNPPRVGGGFSVAEAMAAGVPVVSLRDGDGGSKLGPLAAKETDDYFAMLEQWIVDPAAREASGTAARQRFRDVLDVDASGPSLLAACTAAIARFRERARVSPEPS